MAIDWGILVDVDDQLLDMVWIGVIIVIRITV
jgi:hypothetical protein